tara:strand:- start:681 stop:1940 length:1260 start_codon:yes stop_codon:yes gene_type:complete
MKIKFYIPTPDDRDAFNTTSFLLSCSLTEQDLSRRRYRSLRHNKYGEIPIRISKPHIGGGYKIDPLNKKISEYVNNVLIPSSGSRGESKLFTTESRIWHMMLTFRYKDGDSMVIIRRKNASFYIDNKKVSKKALVTMLAQILYRSCFTRDMETMDKYIDKCINLPYIVSYVLENRTPYYFYHLGVRYNVRINTKQISETDAALEISEGIWAAISIKDLSIFATTFIEDSSRSKQWHRIPAVGLWEKLLGSPPKSSELKLMIEWLKQNRTEKMVEDRAFTLLNDLVNEYEEFELVSFDDKKSIYIKGKLADWVIVPKQQESRSRTITTVRHQGVNTFRFDRYQDDSTIYETEGPEKNGKIWRGPICIDNLHSNSSIGDQMAARAMMLRNDEKAHKLIHTLRGVDFTKSSRLKEPLIQWRE